MTPQFSRDAGRVLASLYFVYAPAELDGADLVRWHQERDAEKDTLFQAIENANSYADLTGEAKAIYDRAADVVVNVMAQEDVYERLYGPLAVTGDGERPAGDDQTPGG